MNNGTRQGGNPSGGETIRFGQKFVESEQFSAIFREGMALVEETAAYLDGDGRAESRNLTSTASLAYATESMRLTTRLMQLASWLLLRRAVNEGEMTAQEALSEKDKVKLNEISTHVRPAGFDELPEKLKDLIARSVRLLDRIQRLDKLIHDEAGADEMPGNAVSQQMDRLRSLFGEAKE